jgi:hypothetical protein
MPIKKKKKKKPYLNEVVFVTNGLFISMIGDSIRYGKEILLGLLFMDLLRNCVDV